MYYVHVIALVLLIVGGLNWGLVGLANYDLVAALFGSASRAIYALVGAAAIVELVYWVSTADRSDRIDFPRAR